MPIHNFDFSAKNNDAGVRPEPNPVVPVDLPNQPNLSRVDSKSFDQEINTATEDVHNVLPIGLRSMDGGIKNFFSDITIPSKDSARKVEVRIAGGDKSILYWKQDLDSGRIKLPVISINNTGWRFNPERHTPSSAGHYFYRRFADQDGTRMVQSPREYPVLIDYVLSAWAERKRDMEYINFQVITRFNPLAEWIVEDEFMRGFVYGTLDGVSDNSDIDIDANQWAKVRYDFNVTVEGWIPLPGRITPTVLGRVASLEDLDTNEFYGAVKSSSRGI